MLFFNQYTTSYNGHYLIINNAIYYGIFKEIAISIQDVTSILHWFLCYTFELIRKSIEPYQINTVPVFASVLIQQALELTVLFIFTLKLFKK